MFIRIFVRTLEHSLQITKNEQPFSGCIFVLRLVQKERNYNDSFKTESHGAGEFDAVQQPDMEGFDKTSNYKDTWELIENGPVYAKFKIRIPIRDAAIEQTVTVYNQMKKMDFDIALLNWKMKLYREYRVMFPLDMSEYEVSYEIPFGKLRVGKDEMPGAAGERYNTENKLQYPWGIGNWLAASNKDFGVTLSSSVVVADYIDPTDEAVDYPVSLNRSY